MHGSRAFVLALAVLAVVCAPALARAQASGATVNASGQKYPERFIGGQDVGQSQRPVNLNPLGISYQDCSSDMVLRFPVLVSGFDGTENLQVWASKSSDCTATADRGIGIGGAVCWLLPGGFTAQPYLSPQTVNIEVRVQDIIAWQNSPPFPTGYHQAGAEACSAQPTFAAVPININFLPMDSSNQNVKGTPYQYTLNTDLVGPPAPTGVGETVGHTLFNVTWTANSDTDTVGYDVYIDPIAGQEGAESGASSAVDSGGTLVCPGSGSSSGSSSGGITPTTDATADGSAEGGSDATAADASSQPDAGSAYDAGCYYVNQGGSPTVNSAGYNCNDSLLTSAITQDAGAATVVVTTDDAGNPIEGGVSEGPGGISTIPTANLVGTSNNYQSPTIADKAVGQYTIQGLQDGVTYTVVVAAVDGYGNIGAPSAEVCDYPAPVQDFWQTYRQDGGGAGGFCALESVGAGGGSLAGVAGLFVIAGIARRRTRARS
jgi:hypothetical protein